MLQLFLPQRIVTELKNRNKFGDEIWRKPKSYEWPISNLLGGLNNV